MILFLISIASALVVAPVALADSNWVPPTVILLTVVVLALGKLVALIAALPLETVTTGVNPPDTAGPTMVTTLPAAVAL